MGGLPSWAHYPKGHLERPGQEARHVSGADGDEAGQGVRMAKYWLHSSLSSDCACRKVNRNIRSEETVFGHRSIFIYLHFFLTFWQ